MQKQGSKSIGRSIRHFIQMSRYTAASRVYQVVFRRLKPTSTALFNAELFSEPENGRIISFSPHPDDDILAAGGTLARHKSVEAKITSIVLTDGSRGRQDTMLDPGLGSIRENETREAAGIIGLDEVIFHREPDGDIRAGSKLLEKTAEIMDRLQPVVIYLPFLIDYHWDHIRTGELIVQAAGIARWEGILRCYECIMPLIPNVLSDITGFVEIKRRAVKCFVSQNEVSDYESTIVEGLNRLRTHGLLKGRGYAEAFFQTSVDFYRFLLDQFLGKSALR